jgi:adenylate cyclase
VFIGLTASGLVDVFPTPFGEGIMPGIQLHASMADSILSNDFVRPAPKPTRVLSTIGLAMLIGLMATTLPYLGAAAGALLVISGWTWLSLYVFRDGLWLNVSQPLLGCALALFGGTAYQYFVEGAEKRAVKRLFGRFVSKDVFHQLMANPELARLGGKRREMTVLFSDIRGFTPISEKLSPEEIAELLRDYMTSMTDAVFKHGGTVTQFVGDEIMALYNAPFDQDDHAGQAVHTALAFQAKVEELSKRWQARCGAALRTGVGINTGPAVVGVIGSAQRVEYGAIGDTINVGSRLEGLTKEFATPIVIGEATRELVKGRFRLRPLGEIAVRGKAVPVKMYGVEGVAQRSAERVTVTAPLTITETTGEVSVSMPAFVSDLSLTGLLAVGLPKPLTTGQVVALRLELPGPQPITIDADARVARCHEDMAGLSFLHLSPENQRSIETFLKRAA